MTRTPGTNPSFTQTRDVPLLGGVRIAEKNGSIEQLDLSAKGTFAPLAEAVEKETPLLREAFRQLGEYLAGTRREFDLPLAPQGTPFQRRVWDALQGIPYGQTRTYRQIAEAADCPKGYRAVGMANNRNPIAILIPCHRVIGADGSLVGYGSGLPTKEKLLRLEGSL